MQAETCPTAAHLSKCPPFCGMVILMTFMCALKTVRLLSRNFSSTSIGITIHLKYKQ